MRVHSTYRYNLPLFAIAHCSSPRKNIGDWKLKYFRSKIPKKNSFELVWVNSLFMKRGGAFNWQLKRTKTVIFSNWVMSRHFASLCKVSQTQPFILKFGPVYIYFDSLCCLLAILAPSLISMRNNIDISVMLNGPITHRATKNEHISKLATEELLSTNRSEKISEMR